VSQITSTIFIFQGGIGNVKEPAIHRQKTSLYNVYSFFSGLVAASYEAKVSQAGITIAKTTAPNSTQRILTMEVTARQIVNEWEIEDMDFDSTCGYSGSGDCTEFWVQNTMASIASAAAEEDKKIGVSRLGQSMCQTTVAQATSIRRQTTSICAIHQ
jgi:hypothetical protein